MSPNLIKNGLSIVDKIFVKIDFIASINQKEQIEFNIFCCELGKITQNWSDILKTLAVSV